MILLRRAALISAILAFALSTAPAQGGKQQIDEATALKEITRRTEVTLKSISAPTGVLGVKWIWSSAQIMAVRPNVHPSKPGKLGELEEATTFYGRSAMVYYKVGEPDLLADVFVVYSSGSLPLYKSTQQKLVNDYGEMQSPTLDAQGNLSSDKSWPNTNWGKAGITHTLIAKPDGSYSEGIGFYLTFPNH